MLPHDHPVKRKIDHNQAAVRKAKKKRYQDDEGLPKVLSTNYIQLRKEYIKKWTKLLKWTLEDEQVEIEKRLKEWDREKLQKEGLGLFSLQASTCGSLFGEMIIKLEPSEGEQLSFNRFGNNDMIMLTEDGEDPLTNAASEGFILEKTKQYISIVIKKLPRDLDLKLWRLDRSANRVSYDRCLDALEAFFADEKSTELRDIIIGNIKKGDLASAVAQPPAESLSRYFTKDRFPPDYDTWRLNPNQREIIESVLQRKLSLIQGPPGTGKTSTAIHLIRLMVHLLNGNAPILIAADTNIAVDNILEGLANLGIKSLRIGKPVKIREELRDMSLEGHLTNHPWAKQLENLQKTLDDVQSNEKASYEVLSELLEKIRRKKQIMIQDILKECPVIAATAIGSAHDLLDGIAFPVVIIDEATQATEPATLCPIIKHTQQIILLGDHHQLPPTVTSKRAAENGLGESLFQRFINNKVEPFMLQMQYRMHPTISYFPSKQFYDGKIQDGIKREDRIPAKGFNWPVDGEPIAFIPVMSREETVEFGMVSSKCNNEEADAVIRIVKQFIESGEVDSKKIGIITPYSGQVKLIGDTLAAQQIKVSVNTVDGFQGREKDVILFSCVRSNKGGQVGFLSDWRRLNVGLTRAIRGLIVVGNEETLRNDKNWSAWLDWVHENHFIHNLPPQQQTLQQKETEQEPLPTPMEIAPTTTTTTTEETTTEIPPTTTTTQSETVISQEIPT